MNGHNPPPLTWPIRVFKRAQVKSRVALSSSIGRGPLSIPSRFGFWSSVEKRSAEEQNQKNIEEAFTVHDILDYPVSNIVYSEVYSDYVIVR